jgi:hypothetical protein
MKGIKSLNFDKLGTKIAKLEMRELNLRIFKNKGIKTIFKSNLFIAFYIQRGR